jgi:hypothetical protein
MSIKGDIQIEVDDRRMFKLKSGAQEWMRVPVPFRVWFLGNGSSDGTYAAVEEKNGELLASGVVCGADGTQLTISDRWSRVDETTVEIYRDVLIQKSGKSLGIRVELETQTTCPETDTLIPWQFFVSCALYNKNDTDHDGVEDYLKTFVQDFRDDRLGNLAVLAFHSELKRYVALTRVDKPLSDTAISKQQLKERHFVQVTDIGSLGLAPATDAPGQILLRANQPFSEEVSFCLNTNGDGWAAYHPNESGTKLTARYRLTIAPSASLTDAIWEITTRQMKALGTAPAKPNFTLEDSLQFRQALTQSYYRTWEKKSERVQPAGYAVHFSPRSGKTQGTLIEYGFCGAQTLLAYSSLKYGYAKRLPEQIERARTVIDFFVDHCQTDNGYCHGIYDVEKREFVYWFTGILLPFQYSSDQETLKRYLGSQMTRALAPVAEQLRKIKGNYLRSMCETIYSILLAYQLETKQQRTQAHWLLAGEKFGAFLLRTQATDGSWYRGYDVDANGLTQPPEWFGFSETEQKSGTIFPVQVLVELYRITNETRYLQSAEKAGAFIIRTFVDPVEYVGGLNDTTHVKSVKTDAIAVMFVMRSLLKLYEVTNKVEYLTGATKAAKILGSWVYLWNVPFPTDSLLGRSGFKSTGWAGCDVIPGGSYLDNEFLEFTGDLIRIADYTQNQELFDIAELVEYGMQSALSTPNDLLGYVAPGIQCEGIMTSYWISDPETTEFSGAVNKVKGQDNDTCNGLINGQAAYGIFDLLDHFGTTDLDAIRSRLFGRDSRLGQSKNMTKE